MFVCYLKLKTKRVVFVKKYAANRRIQFVKQNVKLLNKILIWVKNVEHLYKFQMLWIYIKEGCQKK